MKAIILSGGYATRLWPLTKHIPKALLPIAGKPICDFLIEKIVQIKEIESIIISTNATFENHFRYWSRGIKQSQKIKLVIEQTKCEEEKLGAIGAIKHVLEQENLTDDLLIIAGDNIFDFQLTDFINFYKKHQKPVMAFCDLKNIEKVKGKYGVGVLSKNNKIIDFQEKPMEPLSTLTSTGCYLYPAYIRKLILDYLKDKNNSADALGHFIKWLHQQTDVYGFVFDEVWFDIGSFESYDEANKYYKSKA